MTSDELVVIKLNRTVKPRIKRSDGDEPGYDCAYPTLCKPAVNIYNIVIDVSFLICHCKPCGGAEHAVPQFNATKCCLVENSLHCLVLSF